MNNNLNFDLGWGFTLKVKSDCPMWKDAVGLESFAEYLRYCVQKEIEEYKFKNE